MFVHIGKCCLFFPLAALYILFWVGARTTDHRPDSNSCSAQSVLTSCFLQYHNHAAQQQQQWACLARVDDRTAAIKVDLSEISIDHLNTPRSHDHHLSLLLLMHNIAVCDLSLPLLEPCLAQCANSSSRQGTMCMRRIRAVRPVLLSCSLLLSSALAYARTFRNV